MSTGFLINGKDIDLIYESALPDNTNGTDRNVSAFSTCKKFKKNGQPLNKYFLESVGGDVSLEQKNYRVNGDKSTKYWGLRGRAPYGLLVANLSVGEHTIDKNSENYLTIDGIATEHYYYNDTLNDLIVLAVAGGGGGAGSGLTYCSAGGGGGGACLTSLSTYNTAGFPIQIRVGAGGSGGGTQSNGSAGSDTEIYANRAYQTDKLAISIICKAGSGGNTNDGSGGVGGIGGANQQDGYINSTGGTGGSKEKNGGNTSNYEKMVNNYYSGKYRGRKMSFLDELLTEQLGGNSSGNNYGGGGGASLAQGAPANSRKDGVAGTLGAGGSGAGFTAFTSSRGGNGGDGIVKIYY